MKIIFIFAQISLCLASSGPRIIAESDQEVFDPFIDIFQTSSSSDLKAPAFTLPCTLVTQYLVKMILMKCLVTFGLLVKFNNTENLGGVNIFFGMSFSRHGNRWRQQRHASGTIYPGVRNPCDDC